MDQRASTFSRTACDTENTNRSPTAISIKVTVFLLPRKGVQVILSVTPKYNCLAIPIRLHRRQTQDQVSSLILLPLIYTLSLLLDSTTLFAIQSGSAQPIWNTFAGGMSSLAVNNLTGVGTYYAGQSPDNLFDNKFTTRYTSRGNSSSGINSIAGLNTGFHVTIARCQPTLTVFRFATASNGSSTSRDPMAVTVEGTNCDSLFNCTSWTLLYNGTTGLDAVTNRSTYGDFQTIPSPQTFTGYRFLITQKRNTSDFVAYSEVELYGY